MNCEQARPLIDSYADGELDAAGILEMEGHLQTCPGCVLPLRKLRSLKTTMKDDTLFFTAPMELRRSIKAELHSQVGNETKSFWNWNWLTVAASGLAIACLILLLATNFTRPSGQQQFAQEVVASHIRSLMVSHALDVASTDQHTVKPWFDGKLDFSPPVKDLVAQEFPLIGGRLDYLGGRAVAALVYQRHKHVINLFIWPADEIDSKPGAVASIKGYHMVHWSQFGMNFWAVSDLNETELLEFARVFGTD